MRYLTAGESHGKALVGIIDDYPSGVQINLDFINYELSRRQKGFGRGKRMSIEEDRVEILSGVRKGMTIGSPISFLIRNKDWENWRDIMDILQEKSHKDVGSKNEEKLLLSPRPGHADFSGFLKYRLKTLRDVIERSSARETAARVCIGAFAKTALNLFGIKVISYVTRIGRVGLDKEVSITKDCIEDLIKEIEESELRCPDTSATMEMKEEITKAMENGDTVGGSFRVIAVNVPPGLGSYTQWDKRLDARIAFSFMSIPAIKAVEIGQGFNASYYTGKEYHDEIYYSPEAGFFRKTNRAGGIEGGITNGEPVVVGAVMKPIPTTKDGLKTVNIKTKKPELSLKERADVCAVPSASVIGEAMLSIEIFNAIQEKFGRDNINEMIENYNNFKKYLKTV
ncbi:MAG: chorismate synthase [Actinobacteria bacterium]|nr:chorismate synthase [Actinomycetota bacterium]